MLTDKLKNYHIILGSGSPRRQHLLKELKVDFEIAKIDVIEEYPKYLHGNEITTFLAELKSKAYSKPLKENEVLITADTIVRVNGKIIGKPIDAKDAKAILKTLSGTEHEVISSVCLRSKHKKKTFSDTTDVFFKVLDEEEIDYYIETFKPFDKAGAYGIQEWLGYIGVIKIVGSYFNVMGFPVHKFYKEMMKF